MNHKPKRPSDCSVVTDGLVCDFQAVVHLDHSELAFMPDFQQVVHKWTTVPTYRTN